VNGDQSDNSSNGSGAAYVFARTGITWSQQAYLKASNTDPYDSFGNALAVDGDVLVIGAFGEDSAATGVNGDQSDDSAESAGAAYVFTRSGATWQQEAYLKSSNTEAVDVFAQTSLGLLGDTLVVGGWGEDSSGSGVNGDQSDNGASRSGATYVFDLGLLPDATCYWYCGAGANAATDGYVIANPAFLGGTFRASVTGCATGNVGAFLVGFGSSISSPTTWGELLVNLADPAGELLGMPPGYGDPALIDLPVPNDPAFSGFIFFTQAASFGGSVCLHCAHECTVGH